MLRRPPRSTRTDTPFPYTTLFRSIELNDQFVNYFAPSIPFRADTDFAMEHLSGIYQMEFSLPAGAEGGISEPDYLQRADDFAAWLRRDRKSTRLNSSH